MTDCPLWIENLSKAYPAPGAGNRLEVLSRVFLHAQEGETVALLGPSGCGKSTILNIVAGFEDGDAGSVLSRGQHVGAPCPRRAVVFQTAALFPWLTIRQNIGYGLKRRKGEQDRGKREEEIAAWIQRVGLQGFENYYPDQLSGGMQQRAALARVLILKPPILLMDEPFAALDAQTRMTMQQLLLGLSRQLRPTILFVTHDIDEALILSHRVYVLSHRPGSVVREIAAPRSMESPPPDLWMIEKKKEIISLLTRGSGQSQSS